MPLARPRRVNWFASVKFAGAVLTRVWFFDSYRAGRETGERGGRNNREAKGGALKRSSSSLRKLLSSGSTPTEAEGKETACPELLGPEPGPDEGGPLADEPGPAQPNRSSRSSRTFQSRPSWLGSLSSLVAGDEALLIPGVLVCRGTTRARPTVDGVVSGAGVV